MATNDMNDAQIVDTNYTASSEQDVDMGDDLLLMSELIPEQDVALEIVAPVQITNYKQNMTISVKEEFRRIPVPPHRFTPLKESWFKLFTPIVQQMKLSIRLNLRTKNVELKTNKETTEPNSMQKAADFIKAFLLGFSVEDALALLRLDELYIESFEIKDVKPLKGDHLSRAIGRIAGRGGKTKFTIENVTKTRIVLADSKINILGAYQNIRMARTAICNLILGSPPSKVYGTLKVIADRVQDRY